MVQLIEDALFRGDQRRHLQPRDAPHVVDGQHIERIGHREEQLVLQARDGDHFMVVRHLARHQLRYFEGNGQAGEIDRRRVEHAPHRNRHVLVADVGLFEDQLKQPRTFLLLL